MVEADVGSLLQGGKFHPPPGGHRATTAAPWSDVVMWNGQRESITFVESAGSPLDAEVIVFWIGGSGHLVRCENALAAPRLDSLVFVQAPNMHQSFGRCWQGLARDGNSGNPG